jgi:hypothetical protein
VGKTTKRVDRRAGSLFGGGTREPEKRYGFEREQRPWTSAQDATLVAAVVASRSPDAYAATAPLLLKALGHAPVYGPSANPSAVRHRDTCIRAMELRFITKFMGGEKYGKWKPSPIMGFWSAHRPPSEPLTWGERAKLIRPWYSRLTEGKTALPVASFLSILGRFDDADEGQFSKYLRRLRGPKFVDESDADARPPVTEAKVGYLTVLVQQLDMAIEGRAQGAVDMTTRAIWNVLTAAVVPCPPNLKPGQSGQDLIDTVPGLEVDLS